MFLDKQQQTLEQKKVQMQQLTDGYSYKERKLHFPGLIIKTKQKLDCGCKLRFEAYIGQKGYQHIRNQLTYQILMITHDKAPRLGRFTYCSRTLAIWLWRMETLSNNTSTEQHPCNSQQPNQTITTLIMCFWHLNRSQTIFMLNHFCY